MSPFRAPRAPRAPRAALAAAAVLALSLTACGTDSDVAEDGELRIVTTVAPTIPVEAARKAPTTTTDTARPPGSGPKTRAMVVSRSLAIFERSSVMPIRTNISTASSVSID